MYYGFFFKTLLFKKTIKLISEKIMNRKMIVFDDCLLMFLLKRNAYNYKHIQRIFYFQYQKPTLTSEKSFREEEKKKNLDNLCCLLRLNFIELLFLKTSNTTYDKKIASFVLENLLLSHNCKSNKFIREESIKLCNEFLENKFIEKEVKDKIQLFLKNIPL